MVWPQCLNHMAFVPISISKPQRQVCKTHATYSQMATLEDNNQGKGDNGRGYVCSRVFAVRTRPTVSDVEICEIQPCYTKGPTFSAV